MPNPKLGQPVKNKYKVPKDVWDKWHNLARRVYNNVYESLRPSMQWAFMHPDAGLLRLRHWQVTRHNVAWTAAKAANGEGRLSGVVQAGRKHRSIPAYEAARKARAKK